MTTIHLDNHYHLGVVTSDIGVLFAEEVERIHWSNFSSLAATRLLQEVLFDSELAEQGLMDVYAEDAFGELLHNSEIIPHDVWYERALQALIPK